VAPPAPAGAFAPARGRPRRRAINIVGPMGERPLHVCSLSAHRFGGTDFEGEGNYMAQGILEAMRDSEKN
jgi:hypothetical protein